MRLETKLAHMYPSTVPRTGAIVVAVADLPAVWGLSEHETTARRLAKELTFPFALPFAIRTPAGIRNGRWRYLQLLILLRGTGTVTVA